MKVRLIVLLVASLCCCATKLEASPITYSISSVVSGTLGGTPFTNALVTVTLTGDTANVMPGPPPFGDLVANTGVATLSVAGIGSATFTDQVVVVDTLTDTSLLGGGPALLFLDYTTNTGILLQLGPTYGTYMLNGSLGPIVGPGGVASGSHNTPYFATTAGYLTWTVGQGLGTSTFTATTPEPSSLLLLAPRLAALMARRRFLHS